MELPVLNPVVEIPIAARGKASLSIPEFFFGDRSDRFYVVTYGPYDDGFGWWHRNECEIGAGVFVLILAVVIWLAARVLARAQQRGRVYCRRCNYDLTGATSTTCPECGSSVVRRRPVQGRSSPRRLALPLLVFLPLLALSGWWSGRWTLNSSPKSKAWPLEWMSKAIPGWPLRRQEYVLPQKSVLQAYSLVDGKAKLIGRIAYGLGRGRPSPDGRHWAWNEFSDQNNWGNDFWSFDFMSGSKRSVSLGTREDGSGSFQGFVEGGKEGIAQLTGLVRPKYPRKPLEPAEVPITLFGIDLDTGAKRPIATTTAIASQAADGSYRLPRIVAASRLDGDPTWALLMWDKPGSGTMVLGGPSGTRQVPFASPVAGDGTQELRFEGDALQLTCGYPDPPASWQIGFDGSVNPLAATEPTSGWKGNFKKSQLLMERNGVPTVRLATKAGFSLAQKIVLSPDGKWCTGLLRATGPGANGGLVEVWDLSAAPESDPLPPR